MNLYSGEIRIAVSSGERAVVWRELLTPFVELANAEDA